MDDPPWNAADDYGAAFGARLRRAREAAGLAQEELAERAGLSPNTVGGLERGEHRRPHPATVRALANALELGDAERAALVAAAPRRGRPAAAADAVTSGLPAPLVPLIGRETEVAAVAALLREDGVRLVTLTGPGGVGKTSLALHVAAEVSAGFGHGAVFVPLAAVRDPGLAAPTVAHALGVVGAGGGSPLDRLGNALRERHLLLVLDNLEHLLDAAPLATDLLSRCPRLAVLATSRSPLRLAGEHVFPVPPLAAPDPDRLPATDALAAIAAVRLFVARARAADPAFVLTDENAGAVAAVCHRLDGLPLAIELAAARSTLLTPAALLPRLARRLPLLTGGRRDAPDRHRTMRDAIAWSDDLLAPDEQRLFRRLSVFVGGFTLDAAEAVCELQASDEMIGASRVSVLDRLAALVDHQLVGRIDQPDHEPRFGMLETIREFGLERLAEAGEEAVVRDAHAAYFVAWDERLDPNLTAPGERVEDRLWRIDAEHPNLRAALTRLVERGDATGVLRLAGALATFWHHRGYLDEGRQWLEWALDRTTAVPTVWRGRALAGLSLVVWSQGDPARAATLAAAARAVAEAVDDKELRALAIHLLGIAEFTLGHLDRAERLMGETLRLQLALGLPSHGAMALMVLGEIASEAGDAALAEQRSEDALARFRALGHPSGATSALVNLARWALARGDDRRAATAYHEALRLWAGVDARYAAGEGVGHRATSPFPRWASVDDRRSVVRALAGLGRLAAAHGQPEQAARLVGAVDGRIDALGGQIAPPDRANRDRAAAGARAVLGEARFAKARAAGEMMPLAAAVAVALTITASGASRPE